MKKSINISILIVILIAVGSIFAQDKGNERSADQTLRGSGRVNPSTLGMEFDLPLGGFQGRGINVPINLSYSSKLWRMDYTGNFPVPGGNDSPCYKHYNLKFGENSASGWTTSLAVPFIEYSGAKTFYNSDGSPYSYDDAECPNSQTPPESFPFYYVRRLVVHLPSGETHEMRPDDTVFNFPVGSTTDPYSAYQTGMWNTVYYAVDGSNIKYIQNSANNIYRLQMPDGSFYDFDPNTAHLSDRKAVKFTDRNGNFTSYNTTTGIWTDTMGRTLTPPVGLTAPAPGIYNYNLPGMTGTYKFNWKQLKGATAAESAIGDFGLDLKYLGNTYTCTNSQGFPTYCTHPSGTYLFSGGALSRIVSSSLFNPVLLAEIELPTGQKYEFEYDVYGRIEKIIYPTGGEEVFQYSTVPTLTKLDPSDETGGQTNFGVTNRKVFKNSTDTAPYEWTYAADYVTTQTGYKVTINNPDGTRLERFLHRGYDGGTDFGKFGYDNGLAGMSYEERVYDSSTPKKLMSKKLTTWEKTVLTAPQNTAAHWHPRVVGEESIVYNTAGNGISSTTTIEYEDEANLDLRETPLLSKKSSQYEFVAVGASLPTNPVRSTEATYLINDTSIAQSVRDAYKAQNMIGLQTASVVKDAAGVVVSRSEMKYDESSYPLISAGTANQWQDPNNGNRGNPTTSRVWDSTKGASTNSSAYIATHAQFDNFGNQRKAWDAKGNLTETEYSSAYSYAYPTKVNSAVPDPSNQNGSNTSFETTTVYNLTSGLPTSTTDANGLETRIEYDAVTLRPLNTKTFYQNSQVGGTVETVYHDEPNNYWVKNRAQIDAENWAETITYFDGLGRAFKSEEVNSKGNIYVEKEFDQDGRVLRVTNPYRTGETKLWTTNVYDEMSRVKEVILPDGAKVTTDWGVLMGDLMGITKTITDQAGKKRKGITDALGRMVRVIEDPTGQNLSTDYVFDTLGNLRKTIQGEQSRYFTFDSLGRLLYSKQPEQEANTAFSYTDSITSNTQWSVKYEYDDNGNITKTTDARGVYVEGSYDNFNRLKQRNYSDDTPDVTFYYDGRGLGTVPNFSKGKTTKIASTVSETRLVAFDQLGRLLEHQQITEGRNFQTKYNYNLSGSLISETYPSGRVISYDLDENGDLREVGGQKPDQTTQTYLNQISYNAFGAIEKSRLGNGRWETVSYNNRQQIQQIGLGYSNTDQSLLKIDYEYGPNQQNNGSLRKQAISHSGLANQIVQNYAYDDLNRLKSATETYNGDNVSWKQTFNYDRFGNRVFDSANTSTLNPASVWKVTNPLIQSSDNRLKKDQDGDLINDYDYDKGGNVILDAENKRFIYDAENHLKEFFKGTNTTSSPDAIYKYDGEGRRVRKITASENVIFVYNATGTLIAEYSTNLPIDAKVSYLTADHLGSPRIVTDESGSVISRHDYLPFGDDVTETLGHLAGRTPAQGYGNQDEIRKQFTGYERDEESGLDFAQARYFNSAHGRFTSVDPLTASANLKNPQTFNRYSYALNSPYKFVDPLGLISSTTGASGQNDDDDDKPKKKKKKKNTNLAPNPHIVVPENVRQEASRTTIPIVLSNSDGSSEEDGTLILPQSMIELRMDLANFAYTNQAMVTSQSLANQQTGDVSPNQGTITNQGSSTQSNGTTQSGEVSITGSQSPSATITGGASQTQSQENTNSQAKEMSGPSTSTIGTLNNMEVQTNNAISNYINSNADRNGILTFDAIDSSGNRVTGVRMTRKEARKILENFVTRIRNTAFSDFGGQ